jgi:hypothetical protein
MEQPKVIHGRFASDELNPTTPQAMAGKMRAELVVGYRVRRRDNWNSDECQSE